MYVVRVSVSVVISRVCLESGVCFIERGFVGILLWCGEFV